MLTELASTASGVAWIAGLALVATAGIVAASRRNTSATGRILQRIAVLWLVASLLVVAKLTLLPIAGGFDGTADANFDPFAHVDARNALGNVLLYVPVGFFGVAVWRNARSPVVAATMTGLSAALVAEALQVELPIGRSTDVQDVVFNTIGAFLGALAAAVTMRFTARRQ